MSFDPPQHIVSLQNNIRSRPISWEGAVRLKNITEADLKKVKSIDKVRKEQRRQAIEQSPGDFVDLFLGSGSGPSIFQAAAKRAEIVHYMLVLLGDLLDGRDSTIFRRTRRHGD
jgi:V-type H+-transporting ATPase subunit H